MNYKNGKQCLRRNSQIVKSVLMRNGQNMANNGQTCPGFFNEASVPIGEGKIYLGGICSCHFCESMLENKPSKRPN